MIKHYAVFAGEEYYAGGGWYDFYGSHEDKDTAVRMASSLIGTNPDISGYNAKIEWAHVVDLESGKVIKKINYANGNGINDIESEEQDHG